MISYLMLKANEILRYKRREEERKGERERASLFIEDIPLNDP